MMNGSPKPLSSMLALFSIDIKRPKTFRKKNMSSPLPENLLERTIIAPSPTPLVTYHTLLDQMARRDDFETIAIWESIILSPQYADYLDTYFENDALILNFLQIYRSADMLLCNYHDIAHHLPGAATSIKMNSRRIQNLACLMISKDKMDAAIEHVVGQVNREVEKNVPGLGKFYLSDLHFTPSHEKCFHPQPKPTRPNTPELISSIISSISSERSASPLPVLNKGKERAIPTNEIEPTTGLYPSDDEKENNDPHSLSPRLLPYGLASTPLDLPENISPRPPFTDTTPNLPTPDERLFSEPPFSDPAFRNIVCRCCKITGHKQANCAHYFCRKCRRLQPGHLTPFCNLEDQIHPDSPIRNLVHLRFIFPLDTSNPQFFKNLDTWERADDRRTQQNHKLIFNVTGFDALSPLTPYQFNRWRHSPSYGTPVQVTVSQLRNLTGAGSSPSRPVRVD